MGRALPIDIVLCGLLVLALIADVKLRKIPNWMTYGATLIGLIMQFGLLGRKGLLTAAAGAAVGFCLMFLLWQLGWVGAGDVKLMMAVGALTYPSFVVYTAIYAAVVAGLIAVVHMVYKREVKKTLLNIPAALAAKDASIGKTTWEIPYAAPVAVAVLLAQFVPHFF